MFAVTETGPYIDFFCNVLGFEAQPMPSQDHGIESCVYLSGQHCSVIFYVHKLSTADYDLLFGCNHARGVRDQLDSMGRHAILTLDAGEPEGVECRVGTQLTVIFEEPL